MEYLVVMGRDEITIGKDAANAVMAAPRARDRYDLATALRIVRAMETSAQRGAVFAEIKNKNALYRIVDKLYSTAGARTVQPLLLFAYMLKCAVSVGPSDADAEAVSISSFPNEHHAIDRLAALLPDARLLRLTLKRSHAFKPAQLRAAWRMVGSARRLWPFLTRLARSHSFMPSARIASALAFYMRFTQLLSEHPKIGAALVASNYSPEAVGLAAAAHRMGRNVLYINHAPVAANGPLVPPVLADCGIFYGEAVRRTYERRSRCAADVALIGQPWRSRPMEWRDEVRTIGIFLTALTRPDAVAELVADIRSVQPDAHILIRNHPVALLKTDFSTLQAQHENLAITIGNPLDEEIAACDLIICGNSGVAMNALSGGRPVAYMDSLDDLTFDYNGFVESSLICPVTGWTGDVYAALKDFYQKPEWQAVMMKYDASYGGNAEALKRRAARTIAQYLRPAQA